jgi:hypothetical protein
MGCNPTGGKAGCWLMAFHNDIDAFVFREAKGRARHSVRAALGQTHDGAHGVTRATRLTRAEVVVICHNSQVDADELETLDLKLENGF